MHATRSFAASFIAFVALFVIARSAYGQTQSDLFDDTKLHEVRLFINSRDLPQLRARYQTNDYFVADMQWQGIRVRNVGIRNRGLGSRNPQKMGLRIDFNRYTKGQQFLGLNSLVLDNAWQDPSFIREALAMAIFRRMGQPAPREAFAKLYINNEYQGLYVFVESIDSSFVSRTIGQNGGNLFEYKWIKPFFTEYLGDGLDAYKPLFTPQDHELDPDNVLYGPIRDMFKEINGPDDAVWRERVDQVIDLQGFMAHVAIQQFIIENDGILGYAGINNFYLYRFPNSGKHRLLPWDEDNAFAFVDISLFRRGDQPVVLFDRAFAQPDLLALFLDMVERCAHEVTESGWLSDQIDRFASLITPAVVLDPRKQFSNDDYLAALDFIRAFASVRTKSVLDEIAPLR